MNLFIFDFELKLRVFGYFLKVLFLFVCVKGCTSDYDADVDCRFLSGLPRFLATWVWAALLWLASSTTSTYSTTSSTFWFTCCEVIALCCLNHKGSFFGPCHLFCKVIEPRWILWNTSNYIKQPSLLPLTKRQQYSSRWACKYLIKWII